MKNFLLALSLFVCIATFAQDDIKFSEVKHSFGKIKQSKPVSYYFSFTNNGSKPLIIESAVAGCGCTTPEYPKEPIAKSKTAKIKVTYNAANAGTFKKDVTVKFANHAEPIVLYIDGEVIADKKAKKTAVAEH